MALSTQGDIVLDVMRAAEPAAVETARARLAAFAAGRTQDAAPFPLDVAGGAEKPAPAQRPVPEAFAKFEAMVLQTFIQSMLPQDAETVYGGGTAGQMWQAMLAEQLGTVMAKRGGIGIADRILRDHYVADGEKVALEGVARDPARPEREEQRMLSVALVQEIQRNLARSLDGDRHDAPARGNALGRTKTG